VLTAVTLVVALVTSFAAFFVGQYLLRGTHSTATLTQPGVLGAVVAGALYVALSGLLAFGLGAIVRSTAGAITAAFGALFLLPQIARALPSSWYADLERWLPGGVAVNNVTATKTASLDPHLFSAWGELAVLGGYAVVLLVIGALLFSRRDA
jgi:ABC-2 type transport system permease protein